MWKVDAACGGWVVGHLNHLSDKPNGNVNSVEDLEAIWAKSPAPAEEVAVAA